MPLTHDDVKKLIGIIDSAEHLQEMELSWGDVQIHVWRGGESTRQASPATPMPRREPSPAAASMPAAHAASVTRELTLSGDEVVIRAPMLGTFYRAGSPGEKPFVEVGQKVRATDTVCLIEVMKLFTTIQAGTDGTVTQILHENAALVEFDQPLIVIAPT